MNKIILTLSLQIVAFFAVAQNGLEQIIVEKYYISDSNDAAANSTDGILPVGATTYRIYVDMLPGYKFQAAYGVDAHELKLATTTTFFNNESRGGTNPTYTKNHARNNTVMLDSWLSVGAACIGQYGVLKSDDDGIGTVVNADGLLQNNDPLAGIPISIQDGLRPGRGNPPVVSEVGITAEVAVFDNLNDQPNGVVFSTKNGAWASLNGTQGVDSLKNIVLIAQLTTNGVLSFELNIQLGTPIPGAVENYVAKEPVGEERTIPSLIFPMIVNSNNVSTTRPAVNIYPNPANDLLTIDIPNLKSENNSYSIFDAKGSLIAQNKLDNVLTKQDKTISLSSYRSGLYFIILSMDGSITSQKFIKK